MSSSTLGSSLSKTERSGQACAAVSASIVFGARADS